VSSTPVAAIDIGTNSTNLLVVDPEGRELERIVAITRLGQGVATTGRLADEAVERTLAQLQTYRTVLDRLGAGAVRAVATSASRDAANREEFFDAAEAVLGVRPELISGEEEGALAFRGATTALPDTRAPYLVIDIGGGSTELMLGGDGARATELVGAVSLDVGAVRLTESVLRSDPPRPEELTNALGIVQDLLDDALRELPDLASAGTLVGIAGSITTVAAVELGLARYDPAAVHGFRLRRDAAEDVFRTLATEPLADRIHNPGLPRERADVIVGGCCVLIAIMRRWGADELVVSHHNLLDGVCAALREAR
jgi:exopolyphosphatase/guanosine-5'-triphosphate,3'-diphosphate pyrophosphatase